MPRIVAQLLLSIVAIIATPVVYFIVLIGVYEGMTGRNWMFAFSMATLVTATFSILSWILLWTRHLRWTGWRTAQTVGILGAATIAAAVGGGVIGDMTNENEIGWVVAAMIWALCWYAGTILVWRESASERTERLKLLGAGAIACPACGYNLTGLREAVCPECGARFTLDQLLAASREVQRPLDE